MPTLLLAETFIKNRLECIHSLTPYAHKGPSSSFTFAENVKDMSVAKFTTALFGRNIQKNLMTLPALRNEERGIYIYSDETSFWYKLPKLKSKGEFMPLYFKIDDVRINKSPVYLTYYDGVESTGKEYGNKSVNLSLKTPTEEEISKYTSMKMSSLQDSQSDVAFAENFKEMLKTIHFVYERNIERSNSIETKKITEKFKSALNNCTNLFLRTNDKEYAELVNLASHEFKSYDATIPKLNGTRGLEK